MEFLLLIPVIFSFFLTFLAIPSWIRRARNAGLEGKDMNKYTPQKVAEAGGVVVLAGFIIGVFSYIAIKIFYFQDKGNIIEIFALITSISIISFIGMIDDLLEWKIGLGKRVRLFLVFIAAIPLMVINAGYSRVDFPFIGGFNTGIIYPLIIIPLGIMGTSITFNFLAGYNGLEARQGILIIGALSIVAYLTGSPWLSIVGLCMIAGLAAFYIFNRFPASVFPGNVLTYPIGALIAIFSILGNFEKIAIFIFMPYIIETLLKLRGNLKKQSFGKPNKDGSLDMPYGKIYGLEHLSIWLLKKIKKSGKVYEKDVVYFINFLQILVIIAGFIIFRRYIFK